MLVLRLVVPSRRGQRRSSRYCQAGRELPVCDGCAADLSGEKIRQRLFSLACELQEQAQYYIALSRCKVELPDSEASFREMVQSIKHQIWPGTEEANPRTVQRP